ncbi:tyrosine-type recombinase/integrase [Rhodoferax ferrireducens]|uniref:tyrosine-type recombinase/integrase n=1 Tax=Rhodoferax ferrireducens TaxID=192843 RepID=UPI0018E4FABD|nr:tyrosine-type recombinase/integrase [Rhodoferax ferrireducens]
MGESEGGGRLGGGEKASAPARQRKITGVRPISRAGGKQVYQIDFRYKGVQCRETIALPHTKANEAHCTRLRAEILGKIERGDFDYSGFFPESARATVFGHGSGKSPFIKSLLEDYRDRTEKTLERSSWNMYRRDIDKILIPRFGQMKITEFRASDLRSWVGEQNLSLKRIRNILLPLRAVFNEAVQDEVIASNPVANLKITKLIPIEKRTSDYEPQPYSVAELCLVLANVPEPERWTFQLWAFSGLRTGELIGLRWPRMDLEGKILRVTETTTERVDKTRAKTKAGLRTVPLLPAALEAAEKMRQFTQLGGDRVTINPRAHSKDKAWSANTLEKVWKKAHKGTGVAVRKPYELRHTFASQLLSQGENPAYISKLLGHATIEMVMRHYGRWISEGEKLGFDRPPRRYGMEPLWQTADKLAA